VGRGKKTERSYDLLLTIGRKTGGKQMSTTVNNFAVENHVPAQNCRERKKKA